jgi:hypothetical protein
MQSDLDQLTLGLENWIVTLPAHLVADNGLQLIEEYPTLRTNIRVHVADLDVSASYPNGEVVFNIGKCTTKKELCSIEGVPEQLQRAQGINLSAGHTNAVEFMCGMYKLPQMDDWLRAFQASRGIVSEQPTAEDLRYLTSLIRRGESFQEVVEQHGGRNTQHGEHREVNENGWIDMTDADSETDGIAVMMD